MADREQRRRLMRKGEVHLYGYVEEELRRIVEGGKDHESKVFAEALLILLARPEYKQVKP